METTGTENKIHVFEKAGLGKAPFSFIGIEIRTGPIEVSPGCFVGAPGQPMGCCQFCYTGIAECCIIRSSDGKQFIVGNTCVYKTGDAGLTSKVRKEVSKLHKQHELERVKKAAEILKTDVKVQYELAQMEHPNAYRKSKGDSYLSYANWIMMNGGHSGRFKVTKIIEKMLDKVK